MDSSIGSVGTLRNMFGAKKRLDSPHERELRISLYSQFVASREESGFKDIRTEEDSGESFEHPREIPYVPRESSSDLAPVEQAEREYDDCESFDDRSDPDLMLAYQMTCDALGLPNKYKLDEDGNIDPD